MKLRTADTLRPGPAPVAGRSRHEPALDGLRGLAVAVVVLFHLDRLGGGFLGVDLFFVLSGYLITALLLAERRRTGSIGLGGFWARRARRLLPALVVLLAGVAVLLLALTPEGQRAGFRDDALATLGYVANWQRMFADVGYWDMFSQPSPLDHMWSLAVEEQFYLLWPLVAVVVLRLGRGSPRALGAVALVGAAGSFVLLAATYDPLDTNRAYFGTDTRIGPTLLGAALAAIPLGVGRRRGRATGLVAVGAMAVLAWSVVAVDGVAPWYYRGGLLVFGLAAVVVVRGVTGGAGGPLAAALSWAPLRWLGTVSYGVYLWHWPVIVYVTADRVGVDGVVLDLGRVALTLALAALSFVLVEQPIRRGTFDPGRLRIAGAGGLGVALAAAVVATAGTPLPPPSSDVPPDDMADAFDPANEWNAIHRHLPDEATVAPGTPRLLVVGDSGVAKIGPDLVAAGEAAGVAVAFSSEGFCSIVFTDTVSLREDGRVWERPSDCSADRREIWRTMVRRFDPDVVVHYLANAGTVFAERLDGEWVSDCDEPYDAHLRAELGVDLDLLAAGGARVLVATTPYVNPDIADRSPTSDDRVDCRNATYRRVLAAHPDATLLDLNAYVESQRTATGDTLFVDEVHLAPTGVALVNTWLLTETTPLLPR